MTTSERTTAVGVFTERRLADRAIEELHKAGFTNDQIGFVSREGYTTEEQPAVIPPQPATGAAPTGVPMLGVPPGYTQTDTEATTPAMENKTEATAAGVVGGGVIGGILGAAAALLIPGLGPAIAGGILTAILGGAAIGAVAGGLIGALTKMGVPEEEARFYQDELQAGRTLVTVQTRDRYDEALEILRHNGAYDAITRHDMPDTTPASDVDTVDVSHGTPNTALAFDTDTVDVFPERDNTMERRGAYTPPTNARPAIYTPGVPLKPTEQTTDTEIGEPEVPPPTYNVRP